MRCTLIRAYKRRKPIYTRRFIGQKGMVRVVGASLYYLLDLHLQSIQPQFKDANLWKLRNSTHCHLGGHFPHFRPNLLQHKGEFPNEIAKSILKTLETSSNLEIQEFMICNRYMVVNSSRSVPNLWAMESKDSKHFNDLEGLLIENIQLTKCSEQKSFSVITSLQIHFQPTYQAQ
jgi:hypothetical protein